MSDITSTSYCKDNRNDNCGFSPMLLILLLLLGGGDNGSCGLFGGCNGTDSCGSNGGLGGILPIILLLSLSGGSLF